ncbi:MAG TPA: amino acid permease [Acetobacteraceae bacterium]|nr:amino acid permease [Acetobacteraceae bacterium]
MSTGSAAHGNEFHRTLGPTALVALGIGAIIGAGIFSLTGIAAADNAGPAVTLSFLIAAVGCGLAGLCYSELAGMIPAAGSAYSYAYASLGELVAWIIGWALTLEYAVGAATVSVSWSAYVTSFLGNLGLALPHALTASPFDTNGAGVPDPGIVNLPAALIIVLISLLLIRGISESAKVNNVIVALKLAVVAAVIIFGAFYVKPANWHPFIPPNTGTFGHFGISGVLRGASTVFFAYIGFDAVSTAAQETKNPERDIPIGMLGSLAICTVLYVLVCLVLTGLMNYTKLHNAAPVAVAISQTPWPFLKIVVNLGAIAGLTSVILVMLLGQSRVFYAMARDGLLPPVFAAVHRRFRTPWLSNLLFMAFAGIAGGFLPISSLGHLTSFGTLLAFVIVCVGVLVLRRTDPDHRRTFRTPYAPYVPIAGVVVCTLLMYTLPMETKLLALGWLIIGLCIFFAYSRRHSRLTGSLAAAKLAE